MKKIILIASMLASLTYLNASDRGSTQIQVTSSNPVYSSRSNRVQSGYSTRVRQVQVPCGNSHRDTNSIGLDTLIGIGAGIAIGNQIGKGRGRQAAKVGGAVIGGYTANQMRGGSSNEICYQEEEYNVPEYKYVKERVISGWNNCGYIQGQKICAKSSHRKEYLTVTFYAR